MAGLDENDPGVLRPEDKQDGVAGGVRFVFGGGRNRRALSIINQNIAGAPPYPCVVRKRGLTEKHVLVHRPITRKFAAQMINNKQQQTEPKEIPNVKLVEKKPEDRSIVDPKDVEVEMEDIDLKETLVDIDSVDKNNHLALVEYIDDLYAFYRKLESSNCVPPNYMAQQADINDRMRGILIDWLIEVHYKFEMMEETLYLTVNLIDRFLAVQSVARKKLKLVGVTAMLLACKYEEGSTPVVADLILISDKAYTRKEVLEMEKLMVNSLQFNLSVPTPYVFMRRFLKAAQSDEKLELLSFFMIELCLMEYEMLKFKPSLLAASAIFTAQCCLGGSKQWSNTSVLHSCYSEEQLLECSQMMVGFHQRAGTGRLTGVLRKYSTSRFGNVARTEPANFLL